MVKLYDAVMEWVAATPDIRVATVFGSQARARSGEEQPADVWSDVDLQIVTTRPEAYRERDWALTLRGQTFRAYGKRSVFGGVNKFTALFGTGEVDIVVIPYKRLSLGRLLFNLGLHERMPKVKRGLMDFAFVMSFGHMVVKGGPKWAEFYARAVKELPRPGLSDAEAIDIAELAYVEAVWILGKLERGECVAGQRWLHRSVIEVNFRLMYELRVRRGDVAYPDGRRVEQLLPPEELAAVRFEAGLTVESLRAAAIAAINQTRWLVTQLTGHEPTWPAMAPDEQHGA